MILPRCDGTSNSQHGYHIATTKVVAFYCSFLLFVFTSPAPVYAHAGHVHTDCAVTNSNSIVCLCFSTTSPRVRINMCPAMVSYGIYTTVQIYLEYLFLFFLFAGKGCVSYTLFVLSSYGVYVQYTHAVT